MTKFNHIITSLNAGAKMENWSEAELIREAGKLNNHRKLVNTDHVTIMGFMDRDQMVKHVRKLKELIA